MIIFSDSRDAIFNPRNLNLVPKTPQTNWFIILEKEQEKNGSDSKRVD